jgi:hypothetical protein
MIHNRRNPVLHRYECLICGERNTDTAVLKAINERFRNNAVTVGKQQNCTGIFFMLFHAERMSCETYGTQFGREEKMMFCRKK